MPRCPVCGREVASRALNAHVNICLDGGITPRTAGTPARGVAAEDLVLLPDVRLHKIQTLLSVPSLFSRFADKRDGPAGLLYFRLNTLHIAGSTVCLTDLLGCTLRVKLECFGVTQWTRDLSTSVTNKGEVTVDVDYETTFPVPAYYAEAMVRVTVHKIGWFRAVHVVASCSVPLRAFLSRFARVCERPTLVSPPSTSSSRPSYMFSSSSSTDTKAEDSPQRPLTASHDVIHGTLREFGPLRYIISDASCTAPTCSLECPPGGFLGVQHVTRNMDVVLPTIGSLQKAFMHHAEMSDSAAMRITCDISGVYTAIQDVKNNSLPDLSPLHRAAADGNLQLLSSLLRVVGPEWSYLRTPLHPKLVDGNHLLLSGLTPLDVACVAGNLPVVRYLLRIGPPSPKLSPATGFHALHFAALGGEPEVVAKLVSRVKHNVRSLRVFPALKAALEGEEESLTTGVGWLRAWEREAIQAYSDMRLPTFASCKTQLLTALFRRLSDSLPSEESVLSVSASKQLVTSLHAKPAGWRECDIADRFGNTPLMLACAMRKPAAVDVLLREGAVRFVTNSCKNTPLICALMSGAAETATLLLCHDSVIPLPYRRLMACEGVHVTHKCSSDVSCAFGAQDRIHAADQVLSRACTMTVKCGISEIASTTASSLNKTAAECSLLNVNLAGETALVWAERLCSSLDNMSSDTKSSHATHPTHSIRRSCAYAVLQLLVELGCHRTRLLAEEAVSPLASAVEHNNLQACKILCLLDNDAMLSTIMQLSTSSSGTPSADRLHALGAELGWIEPSPACAADYLENGRRRVATRHAFPVQIDADLASLLLHSSDENQCVKLLKHMLAAKERFWSSLSTRESFEAADSEYIVPAEPTTGSVPV